MSQQQQTQQVCVCALVACSSCSCNQRAKLCTNKIPDMCLLLYVQQPSQQQQQPRYESPPKDPDMERRFPEHPLNDFTLNHAPVEEPPRVPRACDSDMTNVDVQRGQNAPQRLPRENR